MVEDFRSRMGDLRAEFDRIANQAEDLERIVQEQQNRLEEMDLLVRQRDEQLAEQQSHVEELETTLRQHEEEVASLQAQLAEKEQSLAERDQELAALRAQLAVYEATEEALREELVQLRQPPAPAAEVPIQTLLERFAVLESLVTHQGESVTSLHALLQEEMVRLNSRLDQLEVRLTAAPVAIPVAEALPPEEKAPAVDEAPVEVEVVPPEEEAPLPEEEIPAVEEEAPPEAEAPALVEAPVEVEVVPPEEEAPLPEEEIPAVEEEAPPEAEAPAVAEAPVAVEVVPPEEEAPLPEEEPPPVADPLQAVLQESLDMLPTATLVGLAGRDGLNVEMLARRETELAQPIELELADLTTAALQVTTALATGPLLTVAFQAGDDHLLLSPVGEDYFAYLLTPSDSPAEFQRAQAVLLQAVSQINELS